MDSRVTRLLLAAAGCVAAIAALLVAAYFIDPVARWDATALNGLKTLSVEHRWIWIVNDAIAHSVDALPLAVMLLAICGAGVYWGRSRQALAAALLVGVSVVISQLIKIAAAHPRYQPILGADQMPDSAFPSGHATAAMSLALAAVLVAPSRWRRTAAIGGGVFALTVSIALMIQGWHFPSDVLAGLLISATVCMLVIAGLRASERVRVTGNRPVQHGAGLSMRSIGVRALEVLAIPVAIGIAVLVITHPNDLTSYVAAHTSGVIAAFGIAAASAALVYGVTAELETR